MISDLLRKPDQKIKTEEVKSKGRTWSFKTRFTQLGMGIKKIPGRVKQLCSRETVLKLQAEGKVIASLMSFFGLILIFLLEMLWRALKQVKFLVKATKKAEDFWGSKFGKRAEKLIDKFESRQGGVKRSFLIALAFRNMRIKKTRSFVTVGGMSLGIAAIVFLVSIGYGAERLVVNQVARLDDLKMADVTLGKSVNLRLDYNAVNTISKVPDVESVLPLISLVGRINYNGSVSEAVVHGVTGKYLEVAGLQKEKGKFFESDELALDDFDVRVAGATTEWEFKPAEYNREIREVKFNMAEETWLTVRSKPSLSGKILGYVKRESGWFDGVEVWGDGFTGDERGRAGQDETGEILGKWVKAPLPLWQWEWGSNYQPVVDERGIQDWREGYIAEVEVVIDEESSETLGMARGGVLGETDTASGSAVVETASASISATVVGTDEQGVEWVELTDGATPAAGLSPMILQLSPSAIKQAVVNTAFLSVLGLDVNKAIGKRFEMSYVILKALKPDLDRSAESEKVEYEIIGVIADEGSPVIYVPFKDLSGLGITNFSQTKVIAKDESKLAKIREQIENLGYKTNSVVDTVNQIYKLFGTVRVILATFGLVALTVASLGMFNTMTVSLMERTREVGVMKAMGMKSYEVKELFLAEAMVMGFLGGVFGILAGILTGKVLSILLSSIAIIKGVGWIDVSYVPPVFIIFVLVLSFIVGVVTGIYPARRATKISALDALRYE